MPRGGEYDDDAPTVASDNPIESGENKIAGAPKGDSDVSPHSTHLLFHQTYSNISLFSSKQEPVSSGVDRSGKAAPLPEGISEMKDASASGAGSQGVVPGGGEKVTGGGSGKGGN